MKKWSYNTPWLDDLTWNSSLKNAQAEIGIHKYYSYPSFFY